MISNHPVRRVLVGLLIGIGCLSLPVAVYLSSTSAKEQRHTVCVAAKKQQKVIHEIILRSTQSTTEVPPNTPDYLLQFLEYVRANSASFQADAFKILGEPIQC